MGKKHYCISSKADFDNSNPTRTTYVSGNTPTGGQWTYDATTEIAHINANNGGYFRSRVGETHLGDTINFSMEVYNVSGVKAKCGVDYSSTTYLSGSGGSAGSFQSQKYGEWETLKGTFIITGDSLYTTFTVGVYGAEISDFYVRNVEIEVVTVKDAEKDYRKATIKNTTGTFDMHTSFKNDNCTVVVTDANTLTVKFKAFAGMCGALRPQVFTGQEWAGTSSQYSFRASNGFNNGDYATIDIRFYDKTAVVIPLASIVDGTAFGILMMI